jgi:hypothetical protein
MKPEAERRKQRRREHQECPVHAYQRHGKEAQELRAGIEELLSGTKLFYSWKDALRALLDRVDARDSLAYLERAVPTKSAGPK